MTKKYKGLKEDEVKKSREEHGANTLSKIKVKGLFRRFLENLSDPIIKILLIALLLEVIFTFGNCNLYEVFGIVAAVLIATVVSTVSEYGSERAFRKMEEETRESPARVFRDGKLVEIDASLLVVGDIILLARGDKIHADAVMMEGRIAVDQSALNGENIEVEKYAGIKGDWELSCPSKVFRGSVITEGEGVARVGRVGTETFYGMVARDVQSETRTSPLKVRLGKLAGTISKLGYAAALLVGFTYIFNSFIADNGFNMSLIAESMKDASFVFTTLIRALTLMITVVVVAVPEGLPMMITVVLTANMKRMLKDKILVKKLVGIETAGSLNILFTDKTGTLTTGKLSLDRIITNSGSYRSLDGFKKTACIFDSMLASAKYNTDCIASPEGIIGGNSTDRAISEFFYGCQSPSLDIIDKKPFSSEMKFSSVTLRDGRVLFKGAPELILSRATSYIDTDGRRVASELTALKNEYRTSVARGERVIAVAEGSGADSSSLAIVCLLVLKDKLRDGVREAVKDVMSAGIQIVMVTGDNKDTAVGIAEECGFYKPTAGHLAVSSDEIALMSDSRVKELLPKIRVVARALPQDKTRLVRLSQDLDLVCGMTGDGINDAPSLKLADVGFSMGGGTDIAKGAGDIVILDNSFSAISKTILYGRTIFKSIRKFITFQLIMNLAACGITLIGQFIGIDSPITIIQMLWVNIIMDTLGGLAFAGEAPLHYYMKEKPKRRDEPILNSSMIWQIILCGGYTLLLLVLFLRHGFFSGFYQSNARLMTAFYALFIFSGLFNCLCARSERLFIFRGIIKNRLFILIMLFISVIQVLIIYFGGTLFRSTPLTWKELLLAVSVAFTVLIFDSFRRIIDKLK